MRTVDIQERRARLGVRHRLATPASDAVEATRSMVALHSSDPVTVYLSAWARVPGFEVEHLEQALYSERSLLRMYGMRRTLWVVEREMVPVVQHSTTRSIGIKERNRNARLLERNGVTEDGAAWLDEVTPRVLAKVRENGEILTRDLSPQLEGLDQKVEVYSKSGKLQGSFGLVSRAILQLSIESKLVRARPAGTWVSEQYRWADMADWLGEPIAGASEERASAELVRRWLWTFGPATETDMRWWTGWNLGQLRRALADIGAVEVGIDDDVGYLLPDDVEPVANPGPWVAFLPSLDPTAMGWKERDWYLGDRGDVLFDHNGNAGPTVWVDGRVVGGWAQRQNGEIVYEVFDDVGSEAALLIEEAAAALQQWMSDKVVTPRFRSPHDRELTS